MLYLHLCMDHPFVCGMCYKMDNSGNQNRFQLIYWYLVSNRNTTRTTTTHRKTRHIVFPKTTLLSHLAYTIRQYKATAA